MSKTLNLIRSNPVLEQEYIKNKKVAKQHFIDIGEWEKFENPVLHHLDANMMYEDIERYVKFNFDDVVVMEKSDHSKLHNTGENNPSKRPEVREKLKGENNPMYGKSAWDLMSDDAVEKRKISQREKMSHKRWYNNGIRNIYINEWDSIPKGFKRGMVKKSMKEEVVDNE